MIAKITFFLSVITRVISLLWITWVGWDLATHEVKTVNRLPIKVPFEWLDKFSKPVLDNVDLVLSWWSRWVDLFGLVPKIIFIPAFVLVVWSLTVDLHRYYNPGYTTSIGTKLGLFFGHGVSASVLVHLGNRVTGVTPAANDVVISFRFFSLVREISPKDKQALFEETYTAELVRLSRQDPGLAPGELENVILTRAGDRVNLLAEEYLKNCSGAELTNKAAHLAKVHWKEHVTAKVEALTSFVAAAEQDSSWGGVWSGLGTPVDWFASNPGKILSLVGLVIILGGITLGGRSCSTRPLNLPYGNH